MRTDNSVINMIGKVLQGNIVAYCADVNAGVIFANGVRYIFKKNDWKPELVPVKNMPVTFHANSGRALNVNAL